MRRALACAGVRTTRTPPAGSARAASEQVRVVVRQRPEQDERQQQRRVEHLAQEQRAPARPSRLPLARRTLDLNLFSHAQRARTGRRGAGCGGAGPGLEERLRPEAALDEQQRAHLRARAPPARAQSAPYPNPNPTVNPIAAARTPARARAARSGRAAARGRLPGRQAAARPGRAPAAGHGRRQRGQLGAPGRRRAPARRARGVQRWCVRGPGVRGQAARSGGAAGSRP